MLVACDRSEVVIVVLPTVLAECMFVLESFCEYPRGPIVAAPGRLIASPNVEISGVEIHLDALHRYQKTRVHFADCLIAATSTAQDMPVATFDEDFRKFADVRVETNSSPKPAALTKQLYR